MASTGNQFALKQSTQALQQSAELANVSTQKTGQVPLVAGAQRNTVVAPVKTLARLGLWISIFFDGTGNNLEADRNTNEHSNVSRLYLAHQTRTGPETYIPIYVPGLGTPFKEVDDEGGAFGNGFGGYGEARLQWVMNKLEHHIKSSASKGGDIYLALFGFSRGATLARAFALRVAERCERKGQAWVFQPSERPLSIYFMGLFDTVASVGLAMSANNGGALGQASTRMAIRQRINPASPSLDSPIHLKKNVNSPFFISVGAEPGADPASGDFDGHMAWAQDLRIPPMVEQCVHMVAAHEIRNSFPLDSTLEGQFYPSNCVEIVYPGSHSDVGGGYRPGEGARGLTSGSLLSLIPLRRMWQTAVLSGVPLQSQLDAPRQKDFGMDSASMRDFPTLQRRFNHYMTSLKVGTGEGLSIGKQMLAHMKLYYQWRFQDIARNLKNRLAHKPTHDERVLKRLEPGWAAERTAHEARMTQLKAEEKQALKELERRGMAEILAGQPPGEQAVLDLQKLQQLAKQKQDEYMNIKAMVSTLPNTDGSLSENLRLYDDQLMADATLIKYLSKIRKLRPHYKALLEAYEDEFEKGKGLRDAEIIAFFEDYVHDSLAGFAGDATLPSDPRVIYIKGNEKAKYAMREAGRSSVVDLG